MKRIRIKTSAQVQAEIASLEETFELAAATLRDILDEQKPHNPYYLERLISQLNLCTEIAQSRARLEYELIGLSMRGK